MLNPLHSRELKRRLLRRATLNRQKIGTRIVRGLNLDQLALDLAQEWNDATAGWTDFAGWEAR